MSRALYVGSFDPPTRGHLDVIARASRLFSQVVVGVGVNAAKRPLFSASERVELLSACLRDEGIANARVVAFSTLTATLAAEVEAHCLVKGVRSSLDLASETAQASVNRQLADVETLLLPARPEYEAVSSSLVKELWQAGVGAEQLKLYAPARVVAVLSARQRPGEVE